MEFVKVGATSYRDAVADLAHARVGARDRSLPWQVLSIGAATVVGVVVGSAGGGRAGMAVLALVGGVAAAVLVIRKGGVTALVLALMAVAVFTVPMNDLRIGVPVPVSDVFLAVAAGLVVLSRLFRRREPSPSRFGPLILAASVIFFGGLVGTFFTADFRGSLVDLVRFGISTVGVLVLFSIWAPGRRELRLLTWAYVLGAVVNVGVGYFFVRDFTARLIGLAVHSNHLGMASVLAFGAAVGLALTSGPRGRAAAAAACLLLTGGIVLSGSRAALGAEVAAVLVMLAVTRNWRVLGVGAVLTVAAIALVAVGVVRLPASSALARVSGGASTQVADEERAEYREATLEQIEAHPLTGVGFNFAKVAHNIYLQVLASAGVIGLLGFLGVAALVVAMAIKTALPGPQHDLWPAGMIAAYVAYLAAGVVSNLLWDRWLWVYLSLAVAVSATSSHSASPHSTSPLAAGQGGQGEAPVRPVPHAVGAGST